MLMYVPLSVINIEAYVPLSMKSQIPAIVHTLYGGA
jgi:hypothetical protein